MVTKYGYTTTTEVEARSGISYSAEKSVKYTNTVQEGAISQGEREINIMTNTSFIAPLPVAVEYIAIELGYRRMHNMLIDDGFMDRQNPKKKYNPLWEPWMEKMLGPFILKEDTTSRLQIYQKTVKTF